MATKGSPAPKHDKAFSIEHDRDSCIGCGACAALSSNWTMDDEGKVSACVVDLDQLGDNKDAAEGCPVNCIHLLDNKTKKRLN
jgi:ferredoxin